MLINIYLPLILVGFAMMIIPSIVTTQKLLKLLSIQTGDYMPFVSNIYVFLYALAVLVLLYFAVVKIFDIKLKNMFNKMNVGQGI